MCHLSQTQTWQAAKLEEQAEAEGKRSSNVLEGQRTQRHHSPLSREKPLEGTMGVRGTRLEVRDENHRQLLLDRNLSHPWEQHGDPASPEEDNESSQS